MNGVFSIPCVVCQQPLTVDLEASSLQDISDDTLHVTVALSAEARAHLAGHEPPTDDGERVAS